MTNINTEDRGRGGSNGSVHGEAASPENPADADDGQEFLCTICDEAVKQEILRFVDELAVPDLRETMACTTALEAYINQVDEALEAERMAVKDESVKLSATVEQLMSKLSSIQASFVTH